MARFPYSIKFILNILELIGFMKVYNFKKKWQNQLMKIYCSTFHCMAFVALTSHLLSTTTRSIRYPPEFYGRLLEDMTFNLFYIECFIFKLNLDNFQDMMNFMSKNFSMVDRKKVLSSHSRAMSYLRFFIVLATLTTSGCIIETYFPVSQEETERLRYIYKRSRPEKRLQTNFWIPFLDDSAPYIYEFMFTFEFLLIFLMIVLATVSSTVIPMLIKYLAGQYEILSKYVEMLGQTHRNQEGEVIYYTNFETDSFVTLNQKRKLKINRKDYDQQYLHQLIRFHQKLIEFQEKLQNFYSPIMFVKVVFNNMMFALCLYQLTASDISSMSKGRLYKVVTEFLASTPVYYYFCHCSEELDDCNKRLSLAITRSHWYKCSPATRRDVCMLLRRIQRPNHLKFYQGAIVLSKAYYLSVIKISYSFVNYMRLRLV